MKVLFNFFDNGRAPNIIDEMTVDELKMLIETINFTGKLLYDGDFYYVDREGCGFAVWAPTDAYPVNELKEEFEGVEGRIFYEIIAYKTREELESNKL